MKPFSPQEFGFDFAFNLINPLDPSIGSIIVRTVNLAINEAG